MSLVVVERNDSTVHSEHLNSQIIPMMLYIIKQLYFEST